LTIADIGGKDGLALRRPQIPFKKDAGALSLSCL